jgi:hypothetical protein
MNKFSKYCLLFYHKVMSFLVYIFILVSRVGIIL